MVYYYPEGEKPSLLNEEELASLTNSPQANQVPSFLQNQITPEMTANQGQVDPGVYNYFETLADGSIDPTQIKPLYQPIEAVNPQPEMQAPLLARSINPYQQQPQQQEQPDPTEEAINSITNEAIDQGIDYGYDQIFGTDDAANAVSAASSQAGSAAAATPVGTAVDGGTLMSDGSVFQGSLPPTDGGSSAGSGVGAEFAASNPYLAGAAGAAGVIGGGYGLYESYESGNEVGGAISGASMAAGASTLSAAMGYGALMGPWGIAAAAVVGAAIAAFGDRETGVEQIQKRLSKLKGEGVSVPDAMRRISEYGLSKGELIEREEKKVAEGMWGNPKFAASRDEKDLMPQDTWGGLMWFEDFGNDYLTKTSENQRYEINRIALENGWIREARGQLHWVNDEAKEKVKEAFGWVLENVPPEAVAEGQEEEIPGSIEQVRNTRRPDAPRKPRPKPMNEIPEVAAPEAAPPLIQEPPAQPELKTPTDYTQAYVDVFNTNQGLPANPQLAGRY